MNAIDRCEGFAAGSESSSGVLDEWFRLVPTMLHSIGEDGRLLRVSDTWLAKLGYTREDVVGRLSSDFLAPESRERAVRIVVPEFFRRGRSENIPYRMLHRTGGFIDVLISAVLIKGIQGRNESLAVITDVTEQKEAEARLADSEARYRGLVEDQSELVSLASPEGELVFVNHTYARQHGTKPQDMVGRNLFDLVPEAAQEALTKDWRAACQSARSHRTKNQVRFADGRTRWVEWTNRALRDTAGVVTAVHSVGRDVELQVLAEQRLEESEARYRLLADLGTDMVFQLDLDLVRRYVSPACREILGYEPSELVGVAPVSMVHPDDAERVQRMFRSLLDGTFDRQSIVNRIRHRDGRWVWVEAQFRALKDAKTGKPTGIIGALRDVSARKAVEDQLADANRRLELLAREDALTGLANRRAFDDALSTEVRRARRSGEPLGLLMIDVDFFKRFNDRYGHPAGDACLRAIGQVLRSALRRPGDVCARYGGEEFAAILPNTSSNDVVIVAAGIQEAVRALAIRHDESDHAIVTVSCGAATTEGLDAADAAAGALLQQADAALYSAKATGRDALRLAQQQQAAIRRQTPAIAPGHNGPARER